MPHREEAPDSDFDFGPSKTQKKREAEDLQDIGRELVRLSKDQFAKFSLPDNLHSAILEARRITSHGAIRRQMQYIGKLMRSIDAEPVLALLARIKGESDTAKAEFHQMERWRERLLNNPDALTEWLAAHPHSDAQQLRTLIRNAAREAEQGRPPKSSRELFRVLRETLEATALTPGPSPEGRGEQS